MIKLVQRTCVVICALTVMALILTGCGDGSGGGASQDASGNGSAGSTQAGGSVATAQETSTTSASVSKQLTLAWDPVAGAASYNLYWSTVPGVTPASGNKISVAGSSFVHTGLAPGTTYYYVVTAADSTSESAPSNEASKTTAL